MVESNPSIAPSKRCFGAGSRETPDIYDQFLDKIGYYRKHTAIDATCLFRAVAEQRYGLQQVHEKVRLECVSFMRRNKQLFAKDIKWNFESYMNNMSKVRTHGSLLELKALALYHKANVIVFDPFTEGKWFLNNPSHTDTWRFFVGHDNHFDSVFTLEYMEKAAECQAIVYEILYKRVFRLPDVEYAVERMLHDPEDKNIAYDQDGADTIATTEDGRKLVLSTAENTNCVLMHSHLCHFHNHENFTAIQRFFSIFGTEEGCRVYIGNNFRDGVKKSNPLLPDANVSCVRQLLKMGITPFPYKAAKSLDNNIYRNVEFDVWMETRTAKRSETLYENNIKCIPNLEVNMPCHIGHIVSTIGKDEMRYINAMKYLRPFGNMKRASRNYERARLPVSGDMEQPVDDATITTLDSAETVGQFGRVDQALNMLAYPGVVPYPLQQIYFPPSDPYAINPVGIIPADANNAHNTVGVPGGFYSPYVAPMQFHVPAQPQPQPQPQSQPQPQLQPVQLPALPTHEQSVVVDQQHIGFVPHSSNHAMQNVAGEYIMLVDSMQQQLQQQQMNPYTQYAGHTPYVHGCFYCYVPNGAEPNDGTTMIPYDMNSYSSPSVQGPQFWAA